MYSQRIILLPVKHPGQAAKPRQREVAPQHQQPDSYRGVPACPVVSAWSYPVTDSPPSAHHDVAVMSTKKYKHCRRSEGRVAWGGVEPPTFGSLRPNILQVGARCAGVRCRTRSPLLGVGHCFAVTVAVSSAQVSDGKPPGLRRSDCNHGLSAWESDRSGPLTVLTWASDVPLRSDRDRPCDTRVNGPHNGPNPECSRLPAPLLTGPGRPAPAGVALVGHPAGSIHDRLIAAG
jgi:hypothetical protein